MTRVFQEFCEDCCDVPPLSLVVLDEEDAAAFIGTLYGKIVRTKHGEVPVDNQTVDLTSYVPSSGALYVAVEYDEDGAVSVHAGAPFSAPENGTPADVPQPGAGKYTIARVILFESMGLLSNEDIRMAATPETDYDGMETGYQIHAANEITELVPADEMGVWDSIDEALAKITYGNLRATLKTYFDTFYAAATTRWEPLANGDPSDPQLVFDGTGNVIMVEVPI